MKVGWTALIPATEGRVLKGETIRDAPRSHCTRVARCLEPLQEDHGNSSLWEDAAHSSPRRARGGSGAAGVMRKIRRAEDPTYNESAMFLHGTMALTPPRR